MDRSEPLKEILRKMPTHIFMGFSEDLEFLKCADLVTVRVFRKQLLESKRVKTIFLFMSLTSGSLMAL